MLRTSKYGAWNMHASNITHDNTTSVIPVVPICISNKKYLMTNVKVEEIFYVNLATRKAHIFL